MNLNFASEEKILVKNSLFYNGSNGLRGTWNFWGDGSNQGDRNAYYAYASKHGMNTLVWNCFNEGQMSLFKPGKYGVEYDQARCDMIAAECKQLAVVGAKVVPAFFDGPSIPDGKYFPILNQWDKHQRVLSEIVPKLNPVSAAYILGCELNEYFNRLQVEQLIDWIVPLAEGRPVGVHMAPIRSWGYPRNSAFWAIELQGKLENGDNRTPADCAREISEYAAALPGHSLWPMEWSLKPDSPNFAAQARAMAAVPGVRGIGGPI